jgi:transposase-like protein
VKATARPRGWSPARSAFAGFRFPAEVIMVAVRWYLRYRRDAQAARRLFPRAPRTLTVIPSEVVTDAAPVYPGVPDELPPAAGTTSSSTRTTREKPIMTNSSTGSGRCAGDRPIGSPRW